MARNDTWSLNKQIAKHDPKKQALKQQGQLATNHFGRPEGLFFYGSDKTSQWECSVDLDLKKVNIGTEQAPNHEVQVVGMQMLCPRCSSPLYIKGKGLPGGREIVIHWDKIMQAEADGLFRPLVSIDGPVGCDYFDSEMSDIGKASASNVIMRCGWRGGIINGHCFDHFVPSATTESQAYNQNNIEEMLKKVDLQKAKEDAEKAIAPVKDFVPESQLEKEVLLPDAKISFSNAPSESVLTPADSGSTPSTDDPKTK